MKLIIQENAWIGLTQLPACETVPAFTARVVPLKSGKGILRLELAALQHMAQQQPIQIDIQVLIHEHDFLIARRVDDHGAGQVLMLKTCPQSAAAALSTAFGSRLADIVSAALPGDLHTLHPMPDACDGFYIGREYGAYESYLIQRGFLPQQMEDKWFIYMLGNKLQFHRSWTGHCIYSISLTPREGKLYVDYCTVNSNRDEYRPDATEKERDHVLALIDHLLIRPFDKYRI